MPYYNSRDVNASKKQILKKGPLRLEDGLSSQRV